MDVRTDTQEGSGAVTATVGHRVRSRRDAWPMLALAALAIGLPGCSLAPKSFRSMIHPAPIVRARAVELGEEQPEWVAVPAMIERLNDADPVVRMSASEGLKTRTGQDFGFVPWDDAPERALAVAKWRTWWAERAGGKGMPAAGANVKGQDGKARMQSPSPQDRPRRRGWFGRRRRAD